MTKYKVVGVGNGLLGEAIGTGRAKFVLVAFYLSSEMWMHGHEVLGVTVSV